MSVGQAKKTLENLIDDRKVLSRQLAELRSQEQDEDDEPAAKVLSVYLSVCLVLFCSSMTDSLKNIFIPVRPTIASVFRTSCPVK